MDDILPEMGCTQMMVQHDLVDDSKAAMVICLPESKPCKTLRMSETLKKVALLLLNCLLVLVLLPVLIIPTC